MAKTYFLTLTGLAVAGGILAAGCDRGGAATVVDERRADLNAPSDTGTWERMAAELAVRRFFADNPGRQNAREEELLPLFNGVKSDYGLRFTGEKAILEAAASSGKLAPSGGGAGGGGIEVGQNSAGGFGVELVANKGRVFRNEKAGFRAVARGGSGNAKFQFATLDSGSEEGVDEVPVFSGEADGNPEYTADFGKVGVGKVVVRAYDSSGTSARASAAVIVDNKRPEIQVGSVPEKIHRREIIRPSVKTSDPEGDSVTVSIEIPGSATIEKGDSLAFSVDQLGRQTIGLTAEDAYGAKSSTNVVVDVVNRPPRIEASGAGGTAFPGQAVALGIKAADEDGDSVRVRVSYNENEIGRGKSGLYEVAFHEPGEHMVDVVAEDSWGGVAKTNIPVIVKNRPPVIQMVDGEIGGTRGKPVLIANGVSDPDGDEVTVEVRGGNGKFTKVPGGPITGVFSELGDHSVEIVARDARGDARTKTSTVRVVNSAPSVDIEISPEKIHAGGEVKVTAKGVDSDGETLLYKFQVGGKESKPSTDPHFTFTAGGIGEGSIKVLVSDPEGGVAESSKNFAVVPMEPEVAVKFDRVTGSRKDEIFFTAEAKCPETGDAVSKFRVVEPRGAISTNGGFAVRLGKLGKNIITVEGTSSLGGVGIGSGEVLVTNVPPSISLHADKARVARGENVTVKGEVGDVDGKINGSSIQWETAGGDAPSQKGGEISLKFSTVGKKKISGSVTDEDGGRTAGDVEVEVLNREPVVELTLGDGPHYRNKTVPVKWEARDPDSDDGAPSVEIFADGRRVDKNGDGCDVKFDKVGKHEVRLVAKDVLGGESEKTESVEIVNKPPVVKLAAGSGKFKTGQDIRVRAEGADEESRLLVYRFEVNGVKLPPSDKAFADVNFSKKGKHTIGVTVLDEDGGVGNDEVTVTSE